VPPVRKRKAASAKRRHRGDLIGRKPEQRGTVLSVELLAPMRFDHELSLWLGMAQQSTERDLESLASESLLHRWGVEPGTLRTGRRPSRSEERGR